MFVHPSDISVKFALAVRKIMCAEPCTYLEWESVLSEYESLDEILFNIKRIFESNSSNFTAKEELWWRLQLSQPDSLLDN